MTRVTAFKKAKQDPHQFHLEVGRAEDYRITVTRGKRSRQFIWHASEAVAIDHPARWYLEKKPSGGIQVRDSVGGRVIPLSEDEILHGTPLQLSEDDETYYSVSTLRLKHLRPAYATPVENKSGLPKQVFVFYGVKDQLVRYRPAASKFRGFVDGEAVFGYEKL